jgi:inorganic pyrophosphatase
MRFVEHAIVVEIPKGSRNKYEMDHDSSEIWLDRTLFTAMQYPADYGFFPDTLAEDGDPLDALVLLQEPTFPGCHIMVRAVAVFWMTDEMGPDAKVLCVPAHDPRWNDVNDLPDVPDHLLHEIEHFFDYYKTIEPGKGATTRGWEGASAAEGAITDAVAFWRQSQPSRSPIVAKTGVSRGVEEAAGGAAEELASAPSSSGRARASVSDRASEPRFVAAPTRRGRSMCS